MHRAQRTADDIRDSHPPWCSFPRGLHLRLRWQHISRLQFKARGPNFHAELVPVHSPLLRESYLVSYPPLTYMLKFSGFAHLTSCLEWDQSLRSKAGTWPTAQQHGHRGVIQIACRWSKPVNSMRQRRRAPWHTNTHTQQYQQVGECQWHGYQ